MLALNIVAADDEDTAHRLTWPARTLYRRLATERSAFTPTLAQAEAELPDEAKDQTSTINGTTIPQQISGTVNTLHTQITQLIQATGATEIMVQDMLIDPAQRHRSRALIAEALSGIESPQNQPAAEATGTTVGRSEPR